MPTYDYQAEDPARGCERCRDSFEATHGMNETPPAVCPVCGAPVRRSWRAPFVSNGHWSSKRLLNKDNLHKHGFKTGTDLLESGDVKGT
jgi:putative FmdB family regulatory protein